MNKFDAINMDCYIRPYYMRYDMLQSYYRIGLNKYISSNEGNYIEISMVRFPKILKFLDKIRNSYRLGNILGKSQFLYKMIDSFVHLIEGKVKTPSKLVHPAVGQYTVKNNGIIIKKICIDVWDSGEISSKDLLNWCDIYFKSNYWKDLEYNKKVVPIINANPMILNEIGKLKSLRNIKKKYDICAIIRVWGDTEGYENQIRLLEEIAKQKCTKYVLAYLTAGKIEESKQRLEKKGIKCVTEPISIKDLWLISAQSRLNIIRLGVFYCLPWRMIDLLAMGACPIFDRVPFTIWPQELKENINYLSLGLNYEPGKKCASEVEYSNIKKKIELFLSDLNNIENIGNNNAKYFDLFVEPNMVGKYIINRSLENTK